MFGKYYLVIMGSPLNPLFFKGFKGFWYLGLLLKVVNTLIYKGVREMPVKSSLVRNVLE